MAASIATTNVTIAGKQKQVILATGARSGAGGSISTGERHGIQENRLSKEDSIEVTGKVIEKFRAGMFSIELDAGKTILATMAGRLRRNRIKVMNGDRVSLELSPYDLTKGRITYRHK